MFAKEFCICTELPTIYKGCKFGGTPPLFAVILKTVFDPEAKYDDIGYEAPITIDVIYLYIIHYNAKRNPASSVTSPIAVTCILLFEESVKTLSLRSV